MSPRSLIVEVTDTELDRHRRFVFVRSPIRVGRSPLNELSLDQPFVSHCHGLLRFDDAQVEFVDIGSTNGSFLHGQRLERDRSVHLPAGSAVIIGALRLQARLESGNPQSACAAAAPVAPTPMGLDGPGAAGAPCAAAVTPARAESADDADGRRARTERLVSCFAQAFLELRRGQQQLLRDLGLPLPRREPLQCIESARGLLEYMLDPAASEARIDELRGAYADLMLHELALVRAISAGARELLEELSPDNLAPRGLGGVVAFVGRLFGSDARWRSLQHKTDELREEPALAAVVLGRSFARAYGSALGTSDTEPAGWPRETRDP